MRNHFNYLEGFQLGQESGLKYFMATFGHPLRFFAYSIVRDREVSEEIVSDSFYKLWNRRSNVKSVDNIKAFLYIATRNACYDYVGSPKNRIKEQDDAFETMVSGDSSILTQIIYAELVELVAKEVDKLPEQQAAVFRMTYLEGLSSQEICEKLNTTIGNVYFAKSKAISTLRRTFERKDFTLYITLLQLIGVLAIHQTMNLLKHLTI